MLGLGLIEIFVVCVLLLILFGPKEIPHLARLLLAIINEIKSIMRGFQNRINSMEASGSKQPVHSKHVQPSKKLEDERQDSKPVTDP